MNYKNFNILGKFLWNRVNIDIFKKLLERATGRELDDSYVEENWKKFRECQLQYLIGFPEFFDVVWDYIDQTNYKG